MTKEKCVEIDEGECRLARISGCSDYNYTLHRGQFVQKL
jgi:hypothetical protein